MPSIAGSTETAVLDSNEFISGRVALEFDKLGIHIREANWGDADIELFMIKQELGEIPAERHPPNRTVTMKLLVTKEAGVTFAEALSKLQAKVNTIQESNGWIKRIMDYRGGFKRQVGAIVYKAALSGVDGWYMGHRGAAPEITLTMNCSPYFYATEEVELAPVTVTNGHEIEWEIPEPIGTAPGLLRLELENKNTGTAGDWHGAISAIESRDHSNAATAKMAYLAEELTRLGAAEVGTRTGSAGTHTVKSKLGLAYQPVLGSKITASGQMSHTGPRNLLIRVWDPNSGAGQVTLKLQWKPLGSDYWTENEEAVTTLVGGFGVMELGEARPEVATLGNQVWEWRILGKAVVTNQEIEIDKVWVLPTEQYLSLVFEKENESYAAVTYEDKGHNEEESATPGGNRTPTVGGKYEAFGDVVQLRYLNPLVIGENLVTPMGYERKEISDASALTGAFLVESTKISGNLNFFGVMAGVGGSATQGARGIGASFGWALRFVNTENWLALIVKLKEKGGKFGEGIYTFQIVKYITGAATILKESAPFQLQQFTEVAVQASLNTSGELTASCYKFNAAGEPFSFFLTASDAALNSTGALKEGKIGIYDYEPGSSTNRQPRRYGEILATKPEAEERGAVCYSEKKMELRSDGCFRESVGEASWARLTPLGFMPYLKPGGLEVRPMRGIVIPTRGDFEARADSESNSAVLKARYRPGYLFTSGAT